MPFRPLLRLPSALLATLVEAAERARPDEACGCLVGSRDPSGEHVVVAAPRVRNLRHGPRFDLDPVGIVAVERAARAGGGRLLGTWHSHPGGPPRRSAADRLGAVSGWSQLVLGLDDRGRPVACSWRGTPAAAVPEEIVLGGGRGGDSA